MCFLVSALGVGRYVCPLSHAFEVPDLSELELVDLLLHSLLCVNAPLELGGFNRSRDHCIGSHPSFVEFTTVGSNIGRCEFEARQRRQRSLSYWHCRNVAFELFRGGKASQVEYNPYVFGPPLDGAMNYPLGQAVGAVSRDDRSRL